MEDNMFMPRELEAVPKNSLQRTRISYERALALLQGHEGKRMKGMQAKLIKALSGIQQELKRRTNHQKR